MTQLKGWIKANIGTRVALKKPSSFRSMTEGERKRAELEDRTKVASKLVDQYFNTNVEFTAIMGKLSDPRGSNCKAVFCSAVREALQEIQERSWSQYDHPSNTRSRKLAVVR
jgi:hypothetical protein